MSETNYKVYTNNLNKDLSEISPAYNQYNQYTYNGTNTNNSESVSINQSGGIPYYIVLSYYYYLDPYGTGGTYNRFGASDSTGSVMIQYNSSTNFTGSFNKSSADNWYGRVNYLTLAFDKNNTPSILNSSISTNYLVNNGNYVNNDLTQIFPTFEQLSVLNYNFLAYTANEGVIYLSNNKTNTTTYYIIPSVEWISGESINNVILGLRQFMLFEQTSTYFKWAIGNSYYNWIGNINFLVIYNTN